MTDFTPQKGMTEAEIAAVITAILVEATLEEKVGMMSGTGFFKAYMEDNKIWAARPYRAGGGIERLGIEPFYFTDGPRGVARGNSTCFPCTMARGATFDEDEVRRHVRASLAGYKTPKRILVTQVPLRASNGKADYKTVTEFARSDLGSV